MKRGTGSVVQRGLKYHARWRVSGSDVYGPARDTWAEADRDRVNARPGTTQKLPPGYQPTLQEWAHWCLDTSNERYGIYGRKLAESTFNTNETIRLTHIEGSALGRKKLRAIETHDIELFLEKARKRVPIREAGEIVSYREEPISDAYRNRILALVSKLLSLARFHRFIATNPAVDVKMTALPERINRVLSADEIAEFAAPTDRTGQVILFLVLTGLRRSELVRLIWSDMKDGHLIVRSAANKGGTKLLPLAAEALEILQAQPKRSAWIFTTESGRPLGARNLTRDVQNRLARHGITGARLHDLRGSFTTLLIQSGVDIKTVQTLARHSSPKTTMKSYLRSSTGAQMGAIENLRSALNLGTGKSIGAEDKGSTG